MDTGVQRAVSVSFTEVRYGVGGQFCGGEVMS